MDTIEYEKFLFTLDPISRTVVELTKDLKTGNWIIKFNEVITQAQMIYFRLPENSFMQNSVVISLQL